MNTQMKSHYHQWTYPTVRVDVAEALHPLVLNLANRFAAEHFLPVDPCRSLALATLHRVTGTSKTWPLGDLPALTTSVIDALRREHSRVTTSN